MGATVMINKKMRSCRRMRRRPPMAGTIRAGGVEKLIPNGESMGTVEGLFRETADYILGLEMRVRLMQIMLQGLTTPTPTCDSYHHQFPM
ncbi:Transcription factor UPBEAT1 [Linum grandiflorum]